MKLPLTRKLLLELVAALYIFVYLYTAITKLKDIPAFAASIRQVPMLRPYAALLSVLVPAVEIAIALLLFFPRTRYRGLLLATALMLVFTFYIAVMMIGMEKLPCSCGGVIQQLSWRDHLVFNLVFVSLGITSLIIYKRAIAINRNSRTPV